MKFHNKKDYDYDIMSVAQDWRRQSTKYWLQRIANAFIKSSKIIYLKPEEY